MEGRVAECPACAAAEPLQDGGETPVLNSPSLDRECSKCGGCHENCTHCGSTGIEPIQDGGERERVIETRLRTILDVAENPLLRAHRQAVIADQAQAALDELSEQGAEQRVQELTAAVERGMADHMRLAGEHANTVARAEAAEQELERLRRILTTLVRLKDEKPQREGTGLTAGANRAYQREKEMAWNEARAALASPPDEGER